MQGGKLSESLNLLSKKFISILSVFAILSSNSTEIDVAFHLSDVDKINTSQALGTI